MSGAPFYGRPEAYIVDPTDPEWTAIPQREYERVRDLLDDLAIAVTVLERQAGEGRDDALLIATMEAMMRAFVNRMEAEGPPF